MGSLDVALEQVLGRVSLVAARYLAMLSGEIRLHLSRPDRLLASLGQSVAAEVEEFQVLQIGTAGEQLRALRR